MIFKGVLCLLCKENGRTDFNLIIYFVVLTSEKAVDYLELSFLSFCNLGYKLGLGYNVIVLNFFISLNTFYN